MWPSCPRCNTHIIGFPSRCGSRYLNQGERYQHARRRIDTGLQVYSVIHKALGSAHQREHNGCSTILPKGTTWYA